MEETKKYEPLRLKPCLRSYLWGGCLLYTSDAADEL